MKKYFLIILALSSFYSQVGAIQAPVFTQYPTREALEQSGLSTCKTVTDGCSEWTVNEDGTIGEATKLCKVSADFNFQWSCTASKDNIMYFGGVTPVPVVGNDVDSHGCKPSTGYSWDELAGKCLRSWEEDTSSFSDNDKNFYETIKKRLAKNTLKKIDAVIKKYEDKLANIDGKKRATANQKVLNKLESKISTFLLQFPQDIGLSVKDNRTYMVMTILKYKLMIIQNKMPIVSNATTYKKMNYSCGVGEKNLTVYRADYAIDDMAFAVGGDEIHVSDGQFLLPNYTAKRSVSASGEKFVGKDTETQEAVSFWFKGDELSFYRGDILTATCTAAYE